MSVSLRRRSLHASRVPEEIKERHRDAQGRNRLDPETPERSDQGRGRTTMTRSNEYLVGHRYSVADAHLFVVSNWATWVNFDLSPYANVVSHRERAP